MAVKKTTKKADESASESPAQAEAKETAPKPKSAPKKASAPKSAEPAEAPEAKAAPKKADAGKAAAPATAAAGKASAPKKAAAAPIKLTPPQGELLKKIGSAAEPGYTAEKSAEERSIKSLMDKKLVRKGAKDKATGKIPYTLTVAGKKHMG